MAENIFNKIQDLRGSAGIPARGALAQDWFRQTVRQLFGERTIRGREELVQADEATTRSPQQIRSLRAGRMYMFVYNPKLRKQLPVYDRFPMIFVLEFRRQGFLGINLHYLPLKLRAGLFNELTTLMNTQNLNENTRLRLSYQIIKNATKYHNALPLVREYLNKHVRSRMLEVHARDWEVALFLPAEQFKKKGKHTVWAETRKEIREGPRKRVRLARERREREQKQRQERLQQGTQETP